MKSWKVVGPLLVTLGSAAVWNSYRGPSYINEREAKGAQATDSAQVRRTISNRTPPVFIGIALSGGGSRAANFGAATLLELDRLGMLEHVSVISSVSGGSIPAAYFSLFHRDKRRWNPETVRHKMGIDFELQIVFKFSNPVNLIRYFWGNYTRTDMLTQVLDGSVFEHKRFGDLDSELRHGLLINATELSAFGAPFTFTDESMRSVGSNLDSFYVARAVATSGAFPGGFSAVSIVDYTDHDLTYDHYVDGGVHDNLGIGALADAYAKIGDADKTTTGQSRPCLFFIIDSEVGGAEPRLDSVLKNDLRHGLDYIVDTNAVAVFDQIYTSMQANFRSNYSTEFVGPRPGNSPLPYILIHSQESTGGPPPVLGNCIAWHISLARVTQLMLRSQPRSLSSRNRSRNGWPMIDLVATRYKLATADNRPQREIQDLLFDAAHTAIFEDPQRPLIAVCRWLSLNGLQTDPCTEYLSGEKILGVGAYFEKVRSIPDFAVLPDGMSLEGQSTWTAATFEGAGLNGFDTRGWLVDEADHATAHFWTMKIDVVPKILRLRFPGPLVIPIRGTTVHRQETLLRDFIDNYAQAGTPTDEPRYGLTHAIIEKNGTDAALYPVQMEKPGVPLRFEGVHIGVLDFTMGTFPTFVQTPSKDDKLITSVYLTLLEESAGDNKLWRAHIALVNVPAGTSPERVSAVKRDFEHILKTFSAP